MNRCDICNKFRKWEDLKEQENISMDIGGYLTHKSYYECEICLQKERGEYCCAN